MLFRSPKATVVLPTRHEPGVGQLLADLSVTLSDSAWPVEVIVVDDSDDSSTARLVYSAAAQVQTPDFMVKCIRREPNDREGGLSGAMAEGLRRAQSDVVVFMDGDGQHPPATVLGLLDGIQNNKDIVVGSRYCEGGSNAGLNGRFRHVVSRSATMAAKGLFPGRLRNVTDPMSGCFAVRKSLVDLDRLKADGFKFLFELLVQHRELKRGEVPLCFRDRLDGESKAGEGNGKKFLRQLLRLRVKTMPTFINFAFGGGAIALLGAMLLEIFVQLGINPLMANAVQLLVTLAMNFAYNSGVTWRGMPKKRLRHQVSWFAIARLYSMIVSWCVFAALVAVSFHHQVANMVGLMVGMWINYVTCKRWVFNGARESGATGLLRFVGFAAWVSGFVALVFAVLFGILVFRPPFLTTVMVIVAMINLTISSLELRWRLYGWRTPEAVERMSWPEPVLPKDAKLVFSIIVPGLNEAANIGQTLEGLLKSTHPHYEIIVTLCEHDVDTINAAQRVQQNHLDGWRIQIVYRHYEKPSKPQQLNHALRFCRGDFVVVIDAEDDVSDKLLACIEALIVQTSADVVQGGVQLMNLGDSVKKWFQVHNLLEYLFWFMSRMGYQADAGFVPLGGNTVCIERKLLVKAGGWPLSLTEDCALGVHLCSNFGAKVVAAYDPDMVTREESPETIFNKSKGSLFFQRVRWVQGFFAEFVKFQWMKMPRMSQKVLAGYILSTPFLQAFTALVLPLSIVTAVALKLPVAITMLLFAPFVPIGVTIVTQLIGLNNFGRAFNEKVSVWHYMSVACLAWLYQIVLGAAAVWAVARHLKGNNGWYKTGRSGQHRNVAFEGGAK
ncbi:MAG: glycosyltransferase [Candidatus Woesebacteria bacterium]